MKNLRLIAGKGIAATETVSRFGLGEILLRQSSPKPAAIRVPSHGRRRKHPPRFGVSPMNWSRSFSVLSLLAAVPLVASLAAPAAAQPYPAEPYYGGVISPNEVMRTVIGMGLQPASEPRLRGRVWIVRGIGREGTIVRVVMDSHTGRVVEMHAMNRSVPYGGPYGSDIRPGPYHPDPRYVMRDPYPAESRAYPAPRPGDRQPGHHAVCGRKAAQCGGGIRDCGTRGPQPVPRGYVPHSWVAHPGVSSDGDVKPKNKGIAAKPPLPKPRPDAAEVAKKDDGKKADTKQDVAKSDGGKIDAKIDIKPDIKTEAMSETKSEIKSEATKTDAAKAESKAEPKKEPAAAPLTSPKDPETTASIAAAHKKAEAKAKEQAKTDAKFEATEANKTGAK